MFCRATGNRLAWLDDFTVYARDETALFHVLELFLNIWNERNLVIFVHKSRFYAREIKWCGRIMNDAGAGMDPSNYNGVRDAKFSNTTAELCEYLSCMAWMASATPHLTERSAIYYMRYCRLHTRRRASELRNKSKNILFSS